MRTGIVSAGAVLLVVGVIVFVLCAVEVGQATTDFLNCMNGIGYPYPGPYPTVPTACSAAMGAMVLYGTLEWIGVLVGAVGFVLLLVGIFLEPPRPAVVPPPYYYPPPVYPAPPAYPPQGPQTPPPQP